MSIPKLNLAECNDAAIDVSAHRNCRNYSLRIYVARALWTCVQPLFRYSPRVFYFWRNGMLRLFGAKIGRQVRIYPSTQVSFPWNFTIGDYSTVAWNCTLYCLGEVSIGENTTISQGTHICAGSHDYRKPDLPLVKPPVRIGSGVWCCADSFIGPGLVIHNNVVVAARAVVVKDVETNAIVAGNPAQIVGRRTQSLDSTE